MIDDNYEDSARCALDKFLEIIMNKDSAYGDIRPFLTQTNQDGEELISCNTRCALKGVQSLLLPILILDIKEKINTNPIVTDFKIRIVQENGNKLSYEVRLIKENGTRSPSTSGFWGVNVFSFKLKK